MKGYELNNEFYKQHVAMHPTSRGLATAYGSKKSRLLRYEAADRLPRMVGRSWVQSSVLDLGCGPGQFHDWLREARKTPKDYVGLDVCPEFVAMALASNVPNVRIGTIEECAPDTFDFVVANCIFAQVWNECTPSDAADRMHRTLRLMFRVARYGVFCDFMNPISIPLLSSVTFEKVNEPSRPAYTQMSVHPDWIRDMAKTTTPNFAIDRTLSSAFTGLYLVKGGPLWERTTEEDLTGVQF